MALVRWEPARELSSLQTDVNRLFNAFFEPAAASTGDAARRWVPAMDLVEEADAFLLKADLPGIHDEDVRVEVDGDVLTISGERKAAHTERKDGYARVERAHGAFRRSVSLPDGIDPEAVAASFDRGVLTVRIPKPEQRRPHAVRIAVGDAPATIEGAAQDREPAGSGS